MFGRLKEFLKGDYGSPADEVQMGLDELHIELMALPEVSKDFTTPEGAILCLEDAYRKRDIEAAVAAKDIQTEARRMIERHPKFRAVITDEIVAEFAGILEKAFRAETVNRWPEFDKLESFFPKREAIAEGIVSVTEVCRFPDGFFSRQEMLVVETPAGWRVLHLRQNDEV